jgi:hypothetical protein
MQRCLQATKIYSISWEKVGIHALVSIECASPACAFYKMRKSHIAQFIDCASPTVAQSIDCASHVYNPTHSIEWAPFCELARIVDILGMRCAFCGLR